MSDVLSCDLTPVLQTLACQTVHDHKSKGAAVVWIFALKCNKTGSLEQCTSEPQ